MRFTRCRVGAQVFQLAPSLRREDEAEMVPVVGAAFLNASEVGFIGLRPVGLARFAIAARHLSVDRSAGAWRATVLWLLIDQQRL